MAYQFQMRTDEMPAEMHDLLSQYPRESWDAHPGFKDKTKHWLGAHRMFRQLSQLIRQDIEVYLDRQKDADAFAGRFGYYGDALVRNLHGHHGWEDHEYFPELSAADPRFNAGLEILETDHADLDKVLDDFVRTGNRTLKLTQLDQQAAFDEAGKLHETAGAIEAFLKRHLSDEEDLAVPIILHHRLRG